MRRLLISAAVLLAGSAQAVDYAQCEAMQKAMIRLENTRNAEAKRAYMYTPSKQNYSIAEAKAHCETEATADLMANCMTDFVINSMDSAPKNASQKAMEAVVEKWAPRIAKVKADYQAAGCY